MTGTTKQPLINEKAVESAIAFAVSVTPNTVKAHTSRFMPWVGMTIRLLSVMVVVAEGAALPRSGWMNLVLAYYVAHTVLSVLLFAISLAMVSNEPKSFRRAVSIVAQGEGEGAEADWQQTERYNETIATKTTPVRLQWFLDAAVLAALSYHGYFVVASFFFVGSVFRSLHKFLAYAFPVRVNELARRVRAFAG